jgi:hypothetical protein
MVPQPAHAALAADLARQLSPAAFPNITPEVIKAIALHDAGWSLDDAAGIQDSRGRGDKARPHSFIAAPPNDILAAWVGSIEIAGKGSAIGGYLVSRHFSAIGEMHRAEAEPKVAQALAGFGAAEEQRRAKLRKKLTMSEVELDRLVEVLQLCDLVSLYLACGLSGVVSLPQKVNERPLSMRVREDELELLPNPFAREFRLSLSAIRHPRSAEESGATFAWHIRA